MTISTITTGNNANVTITDNGDVLYVQTVGNGIATLTITSGLSGFQPIAFSGQQTFMFPASGVVNIAAASGSVNYELANAESLGNATAGRQPEDVLTTKQIIATVNGTPITLTGPTIQATNTINNYTQISLVNKSAGTSASADFICYPDNGTDTSGWMDSGITSSTFAQATYGVTGANEGYIFMSAPAGASKSGNMILCTDSTGTANAIKFATGGFTTTANIRAVIDNSGMTVISGALGYSAGAGGAVTQITSRTTGVTLNKATGAITLVSAAGTATWQSFTVTNSLVAATDTVVVSQRSGTDLNMVAVTAVGAGSFRISFATTGGTTTEQPVFNFAVIKGAAA